MATGHFTKLDVVPKHLVNDGPFMRHYEEEWHREVARNLLPGKMYLVWCEKIQKYDKYDPRFYQQVSNGFRSYFRSCEDDEVVVETAGTVILADWFDCEVGDATAGRPEWFPCRMGDLMTIETSGSVWHFILEGTVAGEAIWRRVR